MSYHTASDETIPDHVSPAKWFNRPARRYKPSPGTRPLSSWDKHVIWIVECSDREVTPDVVATYMSATGKDAAAYREARQIQDALNLAAIDDWVRRWERRLCGNRPRDRKKRDKYEYELIQVKAGYERSLKGGHEHDYERGKRYDEMKAYLVDALQVRSFSFDVLRYLWQASAYVPVGGWFVDPKDGGTCSVDPDYTGIFHACDYSFVDACGCLHFKCDPPEPDITPVDMLAA